MTQEVFYLILCALVGACWGRFLIVAFQGIEKGVFALSLPAVCSECQTRVPFAFKIPVLGSFLAGDMCQHFVERIPRHYWIIEILTAMAFGGCFLVLRDPFTASLLGTLLGLYGFGLAYDHKHFVLPGLVLYGAIACGVALLVVNPYLTNPALEALAALQGWGIWTKPASVVFQIAGGLSLAAVLLAVKFVGELYFRKTLPLEGTVLQVTAEGVTLVPFNGEEDFTPWKEFPFARLIPMENLHVKLAGAAQARPVGAVEIFDGGVRVDGKEINLEQGPVAISARKLSACRNAMGTGDIWLVLSLGILIGLNLGLFEMLLLASVTGTLHGMYLHHRDRRLPFAPHLIIATAYVILSRYGFAPGLLAGLNIQF